MGGRSQALSYGALRIALACKIVWLGMIGAEYLIVLNSVLKCAAGKEKIPQTFLWEAK